MWKRTFKIKLCYVLWGSQKRITPTQLLAYKLHTTPSWVTTRTLTLAVQIWSLQSVPSYWPHLLTIHFLILKASPLPRNYLSADHHNRKSIINPHFPEPRTTGIHTLASESSMWTCGCSHHVGLQMSKMFIGSFWASNFRVGNIIFQPLSSYNLLLRG